MFDQGQYVEAVQLYRETTEARPRDVRYRQQYLLKRRKALQVLLGRARQAREGGDLRAAEGAYRMALQIEPGNAVAAEGIRRLAATRRHDEQVRQADQWIAVGKLDRAERALREVLAEEPRNARALNAMARIKDVRARRARRDRDALDARFKKPVTLEFRDAPAKVVFDVLSKASGINFIYDPDIRPDSKVSVFLRKTPLDEAIRMIGLSAQLETRVLNGNSVLVYPNTPQKVSEYKPLSVRAFYLANADVKKVAEMLKTILKTEAIVVDEKLNMLVMRDSPDAIRLAERLVALEDIGEPEVMLDVEVLEVKQSTLLDMGLSLPNEIGLSVTEPGSTSDSVSVNALRNLDGSNIYASVPNATLKLHDERSDVKILANPKIRVKSKEKANILIGDKVPVITSTSTSTGFVSETVNYVDVGLKLEVQPSVYANDEVSIKMNLEVSSLVREITTQSGTLSYQIGTRNAQTVLRLRDGETQILAGLINQEDRKTAAGLPFISRFPVLDRIFGSKKDDRQHTEIVLSITPHLIRGVRRADVDDLEFASGTATRLRGSEAHGVTAPAAEPKGVPASSASGGGPFIGTVDDGAAPAPATSAPVPSTDVAGAGVVLGWSVPPQVRVGEQFTAVLDITALKAVDRIPLMIGFDPKVLQVVSIEEGPFMSQGGGKSSLTKEVNLSAGRITAAATREGTAVSGQGALLQVTFKALAASERTPIQLLSATPSPEQAGRAQLADTAVKVR